MKSQILTFAVVAIGSPLFLASCQNGGGGGQGAPARVGQSVKETHHQNVERHRSFHERMADKHEATFGVRPPSLPGGSRSGSYGY